MEGGGVGGIETDTESNSTEYFPMNVSPYTKEGSPEEMLQGYNCSTGVT